MLPPTLVGASPCAPWPSVSFPGFPVPHPPLPPSYASLNLLAPSSPPLPPASLSALRVSSGARAFAVGCYYAD
ncbi:hypothetical protein TeGR_g12630 [Tetraparma gracilis]|uniref:Secreted protein n=1 Tax=Tetraparma gracilis TaxID=2962635 RepID=A0ABQ6M7T8_9STRA|nr:hypothetical protein TeGR_g12630 [Tetraparma gracilis]